MKDEPAIPFTGGIEKSFIDISTLVKTDKLILIEETSKKDVTNEIIAAYGFEHLCKDKDGYVYNLSADDNERAVDWLESNGYCSAETVFMLCV